MTTDSFAPRTTTQFVNWDDPTVWSPAAVPSAPDADVVFAAVTGSSAPSTYFVTVKAGESYAVRSVALNSNYLLLNGTLAVSGSFTQGTGGEVDIAGGTLTAGTLALGGIDLQGSGTVSAQAGRIDGSVVGNGLALSFGTLTLTGTLTATGRMTVTVGAGGFTNYAAGTLTGGTYAALGGSTLLLDVGGPITTVAAAINLGSGSGSGAASTDTIAAMDPATGTARALQSTLTTIANGGSLTLQNESYTQSQVLAVLGTVAVGSGSTLAAPVAVGTGGTVSGAGTLAGTIVDNGLITSPSLSGGATFVPAGTSRLTVVGDVSGTGLLQVGAASRTRIGLGLYTVLVTPSVLELNGGSSTDASFADTFGTLVLDQPGRFSGAIRSFAGADTLQLTGLSLSAVTGYSYAGTAAGGVLTINSGGTATRLAFAGQFKTSDFVLSAGPQPLSTLPPSLVVGLAKTETVTPLAATQTLGTSGTTTLTFTVALSGDASASRVLHLSAAGSGANPVPTAQLGAVTLASGLSAFASTTPGTYTVQANNQSVTAQVALNAALTTRDETLTFTVTDDAGNTATAVGTVLHNTAAPNVGTVDATTNTSSAAAMDLAGAGGPSYLQYQYIYAGSDDLAVSTQGANVFLHSGSGNDALQVGSGQNVLDGGLGSNFLTGGSGTDTFFTDARAPGAVWNTMRNFHAGDAATLWGFTAGVSSYSWDAAPAGAAGSEGATLRANIVGGAGRTGNGIDASITFTGLSVAQAQKLQVATGTVDAGSYLYLYNPGV